MELRRCTPEEWELLKVTLIFKRKNHFDQSTSVTFNSSVSVLCSLCHGYKGIWDATFFSLSLSLPLCICVCYTCVSIPGFKSMLCFIFYHSLWETECAVHIVGCLPSICSPPHSSAVPDFHLGIWGSRDADSTSTSRSCHHSAAKSCLWLFLFSFRVKKKLNKKQQSLHTGAARLDAVVPCYSNLISYSLPPSCAPFYRPSCSSLNIPGTAISANILPPLGL